MRLNSKYYLNKLRNELNKLRSEFLHIKTTIEPYAKEAWATFLSLLELVYQEACKMLVDLAGYVQIHYGVDLIKICSRIIFDLKRLDAKMREPHPFYPIKVPRYLVIPDISIDVTQDYGIYNKLILRLM